MDKTLFFEDVDYTSSKFQDFLDSKKITDACARDLSKSISNNYDVTTYCLNTEGVINDMLKKDYSPERIGYVLAVRIHDNDGFDGRIAKKNEEWAKDFLAEIPEMYKNKFDSPIASSLSSFLSSNHIGLVNMIISKFQKDFPNLSLTEEKTKDIPKSIKELQNKIKENEADWESVLDDISCGYAILQVRNDLPEKRDIRFESYNNATKYLGREPQRGDYDMLYVMPMKQEEFDEIAKLNGRFDRNTAIADYVYESFNRDSRLNIEDGYYGTSLSISDVIIIKEQGEIKSLYVDSQGFKELPDFEPHKSAEDRETIQEHEERD